MAKYKLERLGDGVINTELNSGIPNSTGNRHWREYQAWLAEGNTPDPAETIDEKKARLLSELRAKRDQILKESDFMMLPDVKAPDVAIKYRQSLRDMPQTHTTITKLEKPDWPSMGD